MKKITFLLFITTLIILSCQKDNLDLSDRDVYYLDQVGIKDDCGSCRQLSAKIETGPEENGCCTSTLLVKSREACGHRVVINGDTIGQINNPLSSFDFVTCPGQNTVVQIFGKDLKTGRWNSSCFIQDVSCNDCSCENTNMRVIKIDEEEGCCTYEINAEAPLDSTNSCIYQLNVGNEVTPLENGNTNQLVTVCDDKTSASISVNGKICTQEKLTCTCCDGIDYSISSLGVLPNGCCSYQASIINNDNCNMYLFDEDYNIITSIPIQDQIVESLEVCPKNNSSQLFYIGQDPTSICQEIELFGHCNDDDCCSGVGFTFTSLGQNDRNCCEYEFVVSNNSNCKQIFYNELGFAKVVVPGQTIVEVVEFCFSSQAGLFQEFYVGPDQNPKNACQTESISLVCN